MGKRLAVVMVILAFAVICVSAGLADAPKPKKEKKQTVLDLNVDAAEALKMVKDKKAVIIDVRTPQEFVFVGHVGIAPNIPFKVWTGDFKQKDGKLKPKLAVSENFVKEVKTKFKPEDTLVLMCRSGARSAAAANVLAKNGFKKVYSMVDGFEGDKAKEGPTKGKRTVNGWKNVGNPWTYTLKEVLIWTPAK
jgi:rhodanese-related sulfurtransferase